MLGYHNGTVTKPNHPGQLYLKDIQKLRPNTELIGCVGDRGEHHVGYSRGNGRFDEINNHVFEKKERYNKALCLQFIRTEILDEGGGAYWHIFVRDLQGQEFYLDLGNYGAVRWRGTYSISRWLTLKNN